ncbi:MAG: helix-turn-helix domain-containing protein [Anaerolineales bacterium]
MTELTTRKAILDAAFELFLQQGYHGTSIRQIAQKASLTIGAIYHHFRDKEAIFRAVFMEKHPYREALAVLKTLPTENLETFIRQAARQFVEILQQEPAILNLMLIEIVEFNGAHLPLLFEEIFPEIVLLFERAAQQTPGLRPFSAPMLLRSFIGFFFAFYVSERLLGHKLEAFMPSDALDQFVEIYLHGILKEA